MYTSLTKSSWRNALWTSIWWTSHFFIVATVKKVQSQIFPPVGKSFFIVYALSLMMSEDDKSRF